MTVKRHTGPEGCEFQQVEDLLEPVSAKAVDDEMVVFGLSPRSSSVAAPRMACNLTCSLRLMTTVQEWKECPYPSFQSTTWLTELGRMETS